MVKEFGFVWFGEEETALYSFLVGGGSGERGASLFSLVSSHGTLGSGSELFQGRFRCDIRKHFYAEGVAKHWSRFPREMVDAPGLLGFGRCLDNALT